MICQTYIEFFKHLSDSTRLELIKHLRTGEKTVSDLERLSHFEQSRVSHTLKKLRDAGFVTVVPNGKERVYALEKPVLEILSITDKHVDKYYKHYCKCSGKAKRERWKK